MKLLTYPEAAQMLGIAPVTLRKLVMGKRIPYLKPFGKHSKVFFLPEDIEQFLLAGRVEPLERPDGKAVKAG